MKRRGLTCNIEAHQSSIDISFSRYRNIDAQKLRKPCDESLMNAEYNFTLYFSYIHINNLEIIESVYSSWSNYGWHIVSIECCKPLVPAFFTLGTQGKEKYDLTRRSIPLYFFFQHTIDKIIAFFYMPENSKFQE